jgi:Heparinase II/III-like protein/Heparinase II/III N-terminus
VISKLRGRSFAEIRGRLTQQACALAERRGIIPSIVLPVGVSLEPATPWGHADTVAIGRELAPQERAALITRAERIVAGTFDVLGIIGQSYGLPVNWHRDPIAGREAPAVHWSRVPYLDYDRVGDHKVTWELNRHQWFVMLAQAWQLTGDSRYAATADRLLREWLDLNPPKQGINWCSALELAFRVHSWIHGLRLFRGATELSPVLRADLVASAVLQVDHIVKNLSTWFSPNTHLTGEALTILSAGCAWPDLPQSVRWRTLGWRILCDELPKQVRADGVYFEQSAWYQSYTLDFYTLGLSWARHAGLTIPAGMPGRIRSAGSALRAVTRPDGTVARLGDDDGGRTLPLSPSQFGDMSESLWRAAYVLGDASLAPPVITGRSTLLWLEGAQAHQAAARFSASDGQRASALYAEGGWVTLTQRAELAERDHWLILDAGPHGVLSHAHSHADALGIDLSVHGVPLLVDPGTAAYVGEARRRYRSTRVHNTVTVDGADSSEQGSAFSWRTVAETRLTGFGVAAAASFVAASHDGYRRLADPVRHHRTLLRFDRHYWLMFDTLEALSNHSFALTMQSVPGAEIEQQTSTSFVLRHAGVALHLALDPRTTTRVEARTVSPAYALELSALAVVTMAAITGTTVLCTAFGAHDESGPLHIQPCSEPQQWQITHARGTDFVARPAGYTISLGPARFDGTVLAVLGGDAPHTIVAAGAGTFHLAGRARAMGANDISVARRASDGTWTMES